MAVFKRGNYWYARIYWRDNDKKRRSKSRGHFKTKKEASMWEAQNKIDLNKGYDIKNNPRFLDYFLNYYKIYKENRLRYETRKTWITAYNKLKIYLPYTKIKAINRTVWQQFLNQLGKDYAKSSIIMFCKRYHEAINNALQDGLIKSDFSKGTKIIGSKKRTRIDKTKMLSVKQIERLVWLAKRRRRPFEMASVDSKRGNMSDYIILTLIMTGMRVGEASALTWDDIDFKGKKIKINKTYHSDTRTVGKTKTFSSKRKISVSDGLLNILKELKRDNTNFVFGLPQHKDLPPTHKAIENELNRMMKQLGYDATGFTPHTLRHCHVALLLYWGADIYEIKDRLGHHDISTTLDTYGYLIPEKKESNTKLITSKLDKLL